MPDDRNPREALRETFTVNLLVTIRIGRESDLPGLEWCGVFTQHREIIHAAYEQQQRGGGVMLVAEAGKFPVGQVWVDLEKRAETSTGVIWALRVLPPLRRLGIGRRLMAAAERSIEEKGFRYAELGVTTPEVGRFYERLGYRPAGTLHEQFSFTTPDGEFVRVPLEQTIYRKRLAPLQAATRSVSKGP